MNTGSKFASRFDKPIEDLLRVRLEFRSDSHEGLNMVLDTHTTKVLLVDDHPLVLESIRHPS